MCCAGLKTSCLGDYSQFWDFHWIIRVRAADVLGKLVHCPGKYESTIYLMLPYTWNYEWLPCFAMHSYIYGEKPPQTLGKKMQSGKSAWKTVLKLPIQIAHAYKYFFMPKKTRLDVFFCSSSLCCSSSNQSNCLRFELDDNSLRFFFFFFKSTYKKRFWWSFSEAKWNEVLGQYAIPLLLSEASAIPYKQTANTEPHFLGVYIFIKFDNE